MLHMVLGVSWKYKVNNDVLYGTLPKLSDKIRSRRLKLAGHCIRHPELLVNDLVTWEPKARQGETKRGRPGNDIMDHYHITSVVNCTNYTRPLIKQEDLDHSGVT